MITDTEQKELILRKSRGKSLLSSYLSDLSGFMGSSISEGSLISLEETYMLSKLNFDENLESYKFETNEQFNEFILKLGIDKGLSGYVFIENSKYCGAFCVSLGKFLDSAARVKEIKDQIIAFISRKEKFKILLEYYEGNFEIEVNDKYVVSDD